MSQDYFTLDFFVQMFQGKRQLSKRRGNAGRIIPMKICNERRRIEIFAQESLVLFHSLSVD